jgi:formylglycine-generating enzyme required for sulfatase activity
MKYLVKIMALTLIFAAIILAGCKKDKKDDKSNLLLLSGGGTYTYTADGVTFKMVYVPGGKTFPTGVDDNGDLDGDGTQDVPPTATVANAYWIGETEVTSELWNKVHTWAIDAARGANQYTFANPGVSGPTNQHPVTTINWRSAMVWCNALTEWYNAQRGTTYSCVYFTDPVYTTPRRSVNDNGTVTFVAGDQDNPYVKSDAKGFRMLTNSEWELAARYIDGTTWLYGDHASGDGTGYCYDNLVAPLPLGGQSLSGSSAAVKSKYANALGLYDMSGNMWEWCFDWCNPSFTRFIRSGSCLDGAIYLQVGFVGCTDPFQEFPNYGLRFARSAD